MEVDQCREVEIYKFTDSLKRKMIGVYIHHRSKNSVALSIGEMTTPYLFSLKNGKGKAPLTNWKLTDESIEKIKLIERADKEQYTDDKIE